jgi:hypothetical protein
MTKELAVLNAIRNAKVGSQIIIHNNDGSIWCILEVRCKEHREDMGDNGKVMIR